MQPLRVAFIGGHGHSYLRGALRDPAFQVEAVAVVGDRIEPEAARRRFAEELGGRATWFDDPAAMYAAFRPSVVNIGSYYGRHGPLVVEAVERGVPVVVDKPAVATWEDLDALRRAVDRAGVAVVTEFDMRTRAAFRAARDAVRRGELGKVVLATAQKSYRFGSRPEFYKRREDYGSTMLWIASHGIDSIPFVTGQRFTAVMGVHGNVAKPAYETMEDHCVAVFILDRGATGVVHADFSRPQAAPTHGDDRLRVAGDRGVLEIRDNRCLLITHDNPERDITDDAQAEPPHAAMLRAALAGETQLYGTAHTLEISAALLAARDAADRRELVQIAY